MLKSILLALVLISIALAQPSSGIPGVFRQITVYEYIKALEAYADIDSLHVRVLTADSSLVPDSIGELEIDVLTINDSLDVDGLATFDDSVYFDDNVNINGTIWATIGNIPTMSCSTYFSADTAFINKLAVDTLYGSSPITLMDTLVVPAINLNGVTENTWPSGDSSWVSATAASLDITDLRNTETYWQIIGGPDSLSWVSTQLTGMGSSFEAARHGTILGGDGYFYTAVNDGSTTYLYQHNSAGTISASTSVSQSCDNYPSAHYIDMAYNNGKVAVVTSGTDGYLRVYNVATNSWGTDYDWSCAGTGFAMPYITAGRDSSFAITCESNGSSTTMEVHQIEIDGSGNPSVAGIDSITVVDVGGFFPIEYWNGKYYIAGYGASGASVWSSDSVGGAWSEAAGILGAGAYVNPFQLVGGPTELHFAFGGQVSGSSSTKFVRYSSFDGSVWSSYTTVQSGLSSASFIRAMFVFDDDDVILVQEPTLWYDYDGVSWTRQTDNIWDSTNYILSGFVYDGTNYVFTRSATSPNYYNQWKNEPTPGLNTGWRDVSARWNSQNLASPWITMFDPGGYGNADSTAGTIWLGSPVLKNDTVKVYGDLYSEVFTSDAATFDLSMSGDTTRWTQAGAAADRDHVWKLVDDAGDVNAFRYDDGWDLWYFDDEVRATKLSAGGSSNIAMYPGSGAGAGFGIIQTTGTTDHIWLDPDGATGSDTVKVGASGEGDIFISECAENIFGGVTTMDTLQVPVVFGLIQEITGNDTLSVDVTQAVVTDTANVWLPLISTSYDSSAALLGYGLRLDIKLAANVPCSIFAQASDSILGRTSVVLTGGPDGNNAALMCFKDLWFVR